MPSFAQMEANYAELASRAVIVPAREHAIETACERLRRDTALYRRVESLTSVPAATLMALAEREMTGNTRCYLGNGQSLKIRTTIVPKNRGPFPQAYPEDFIAGCLDSLHMDGLDQYAARYGKWTIALFCYASESWNGWGYRARGIPSPYVFGATTVQRPGKFPRDHVFDATMMDPQIGTLALYEELVKQDPSLAFDDALPKIDSPPLAPLVVQPHPLMGSVDPEWVQRSLNRLRVSGTPLLVDGNVGRGTRSVVRDFQRTHRLLVDGIPGPQVVAALKQSLAEAGIA